MVDCAPVTFIFYCTLEAHILNNSVEDCDYCILITETSGINFIHTFCLFQSSYILVLYTASADYSNIHKILKAKFVSAACLKQGFSKRLTCADYEE